MPSLDPSKKLAGLLVPVFALRHKRDFGIGDTLAVREAIDFCAATGLSVLQLLPIHETVGDHSPYNPISSRALSPAFVTLTPEEVPGLKAEEIAESAPDSWLTQLRGGPVKQNSVQPLKLQLLLTAHRAFRVEHAPEKGSDLGKEFADFQKQQESWLPAYTLFRALIREYEGNPNWQEWRPEHQAFGTAEAWLARHPERTALGILREGYAFVQWVAWRQWRAVKAHADARGVCLMGEMSFGVSRVSVDVWAHRELFDLEWNMGTRPVAYFDTNKDSERWGQNWGLPAYRWENHRSTKFAWLRSRVTGAAQFFHACRIDHLRGYFRGYMFPWPGGAVHAEFAKLTPEEAKERTGGRLPRFVPGSDDDPTTAKMNDLQGRELIGVVRDAGQGMDFVAEIMGDMPDYMHKSLDDLELASLTFPQLERNPDRTLRSPDTYRVRSLAAYGNHDHAPIAAWYLHLVEKAKTDVQRAADLAELMRFLDWKDPIPPKLDDALLATMQRKLFDVPCYLTVLMSSDLLGTAQRFNLPGSYGAGTWSERLDHPLAEYANHPTFGPRLERVREALKTSGRTNGKVLQSAA